MPLNIPDKDRKYLRELANKQAEYAHLPLMEERKGVLYGINDGVPDTRPPVIIETWTFDRDFLPADVFKCTTDDGRSIETNLLRNIRNHELINDDKVIPDTYDIGWWTDIDTMGVEIPTETVADSQGVNTGYRFEHPIKDLERDFGKLKPAKCSVDRKGTKAYKEELESIFGPALPVEIRTGPYGATMLTYQVVTLMGMEAFFEALHEAPEQVHRLMAYLRDNSLRIMKWAEGEDLLRCNNGNQDSFGSSSTFTRRLPAPGFDGKRVRLCDMWGCANSQETVGVSPAMFHEFCFPYYRDAVEPLGLLYYGCCEPTNPYWDDLKRLPHLKKISISRWADEKFMGEALKGTGIVYSRKPHPNLLGVDVKLDEEGWKSHIKATLDATPGVPVEFLVRDVYTVHGNLAKVRRAVELARGEIDRKFK